MRLSEVYRALLEVYGGSLACLSFHTGKHSVARLAALLRRQKQLKSIVVEHSGAVPAFSFAIAQGCCRGVEEISLNISQDPPTAEHMEFLAGGFEVDGALPALKSPKASSVASSEVLVKLARALSGGTAPLLEFFGFPDSDWNEECMDALAGMSEARARIPGCQRLKFLTLQKDWLSQGPLDSQIRLLRLLLPSLIWIPAVLWNAAFEPIFLESRPVFLGALHLKLVGGGSGPAAEVLEAMPALKSLMCTCPVNMPSLDVIPPIITALHRGIGLKNLEKVVVQGCNLGDGLFADLLDALEASGGAKQVTKLAFTVCSIGIEGARALADCLRKNAFLFLDTLRLAGDDIADEGVMALAKGLREAPRILLTRLDLSAVTMSDAGVAALASVVQQGKFERLGSPDLCKNRGVTDEGIVALAQAIEAGGLPALRKFSMTGLEERATSLGLSAITHALVNGSPNLKFIRMRRRGPKDATLLKMIKGMLRAARRTAVIDV